MSSVAPAVARLIVQNLRENFEVDDLTFRLQQMACLAEEVGEFVGAARRHLGLARRSDTFEHVAEELADVVITASVVAEAFGIPLDREIQKKVDVIFSRGWKESA